MFSVFKNLWIHIKTRRFSYDEGHSDSNFMELNNFQVMERIIETSFKVANTLKIGIDQQVEKQISFVMRNTRNDIYLVNEMISDSSALYVEDERNNINQTVITYIIL